LSRSKNLLFAFGSGLLLWAAWPVSPFTFLVFVAFIPLLWVESKVAGKRKFFGLTYITMFTWNVATTWWIWNASEIGALMAFLANSFLMCFPWLGFKIVRKRLGENSGYLALIAFWMCFEFIHLQDWGLSWPWLTLGNAFANRPHWVQWYEYTGTSGGTFWILLVNVFLFAYIKNRFKPPEEKTPRPVLLGGLILIVPLLISLLDGIHFKTHGGQSNIVVVQPDIDPYKKVDEAGSLDSQLLKLISLSEQAIDSNTSLVVWPETALYTPSSINEGNLKENSLLDPLWDFVKRHPHLSLFTGIESFRRLDNKTEYSRDINGMNIEFYNSSALIDTGGAYAFYHKSMLVPGVETLPWFLKFMDQLFAKFGGTTAGYARQPERTVLETKTGYKIAPAICYESIYGEYMSRYIRNGANIICIITNDGWWKNTPGHKQHMNYARLRAIETRVWVARSANTGISCFIDPYGHVIDAQPWDKAAAIKLNVPVSNTKTFFVREGDIISRAMIVLSVLFIAWILGLWIKTRSQAKERKRPGI
jgi:apolipoprotein N-acyltransferase